MIIKQKELLTDESSFFSADTLSYLSHGTFSYLDVTLWVCFFPPPEKLLKCYVLYMLNNLIKMFVCSM